MGENTVTQIASSERGAGYLMGAQDKASGGAQELYIKDAEGKFWCWEHDFRRPVRLTSEIEFAEGYIEAVKQR